LVLTDPVPLEYSIGCVTCTVADMRGAAVVGLLAGGLGEHLSVSGGPGLPDDVVEPLEPVLRDHRATARGPATIRTSR
jgi:hypothetical protein